MTKEDIAINFVHLCDAASIDRLGKINIFGIFSKIFLAKVPSKFLKFTIVGSIILKEYLKPRLKVEVKILDSSNKILEIKPTIIMEFTTPEIKKKEKNEINFILDIGNLEFKSFGEHNVVVYVNGKETARKSFFVEERKGEKKL